jgi:hypothetical protein
MGGSPTVIAATGREWSKRPVPGSLWVILEIIAAVSKGMVIKNAISSNQAARYFTSCQLSLLTTDGGFLWSSGLLGQPPPFYFCSLSRLNAR